MGIGPPEPGPDPSHFRLRQVEIMFHTSRGAMGIRTPDLLNAIEALYQLSYDPEREKHIPDPNPSQGKPLACGIYYG